MNDEEFATLASKILAPQEITLGAVVIYRSARDRVLAGERSFSHCSYGDWQALLNRHNPSRTGCPEVKEAVKIGPNILLRTVDHNCQRESRLLTGNANPLELTVNGRAVQVLHLSFSRPAGKKNNDRVTSHIFVRGDGPVSKPFARAVADQIRVLTSAPNLSVTLRADTWFINECKFPAWYPFEERRTRPTKEEFMRTRYASCSVFGSWPMQCLEATSPQ